MKTILRSAICIIHFLASGFLTAGAPDSLVNTAGLMATVRILSSEEMAGRLPGHAGYDLAGRFMAAGFGQYGLKPAGDEGYYQHLNVEYNAVLPPCSFRIHTSEGETIFPELARDYVFRGFTGKGDLSAQVVFAGFGISTAGYDDYAGIDVQGKILLVFRSNPAWKPAEGIWPGALPREKANVAFRQGAAGILFVTPPGERSDFPEVIGSVLHGPGKQLTDFPQVVVSRALADRMLAGSGLTLETVLSMISETRQPASQALNVAADITVNAEYQAEANTYNLVGMIEGSDPELRDEYIVICAHLDHVGAQCGAIYFPGANDNASGSAAVLEIARVFSLCEPKPSRTMLFVLFASEEQGLQGAEHFVANCPVPHEKIKAILNFDCIAHGDSIQLGNGNSAPELWSLARTLDREHLVIEKTWGGGGADLSPFHNAGIPGLYFVSTFSYTHLHSLTDTPETLNPELFTAITRLGFRTAWELAR